MDSGLAVYYFSEASVIAYTHTDALKLAGSYSRGHTHSDGLYRDGIVYTHTDAINCFVDCTGC